MGCGGAKVSAHTANGTRAVKPTAKGHSPSLAERAMVCAIATSPPPLEAPEGSPAERVPASVTISASISAPPHEAWSTQGEPKAAAAGVSGAPASDSAPFENLQSVHRHQSRINSIPENQENQVSSSEQRSEPRSGFNSNSDESNSKEAPLRQTSSFSNSTSARGLSKRSSLTTDDMEQFGEDPGNKLQARFGRRRSDSNMLASLGTLHAEQQREQNDQGVQLGKRRSEQSSLASGGGMGPSSSPPISATPQRQVSGTSQDIPGNVSLGRRRSASNVLACGSVMPDVVLVSKGRRNSSGDVMGKKQNMKNAVRSHHDDLLA